MKLTIQIVNFRSRHYLERCLFSISENLPTETEAEVLVINNEKESFGETLDSWKGRLHFQIIELGENVGFGKAHNEGFKRSKGKYVLFLNPDTQVAPGALQAMQDLFEKDTNVGLASPFLVDAMGNIQPDGFGSCKTPLSTIKRKIFGNKEPQMKAADDIFYTDWVSGGAMLVRRDVFEQLGGFDEKYFMYFEDVDLCLRAKKNGMKIAVNPKARVFHESGKSFESEREKKKYYYASQDRYFRKHFGGASSAIVKLFRLPYYIKNVWIKC
jgi:GT2 family glycosyltransferase